MLRIVRIYVVNSREFLVGKGKNFLNKYSLKPEEKMLSYSQKQRKVAVVQLDKNNGLRRKEEYEVVDTFCLSIAEYQEALKRRVVKLNDYWSAYRNATRLTAPYAGSEIPIGVLKKRDSALASIPEPRSLLSRLIQKHNNS